MSCQGLLRSFAHAAADAWPDANSTAGAAWFTPFLTNQTDGMALVMACPPGFYCLVLLNPGLNNSNNDNTTTTTTNATAAPPGDGIVLAFPCAPGTYRALPGGRSDAYCVPCPAATYSPFLNATACLQCPQYRACDGPGLRTPSSTCIPGAYQTNGTAVPRAAIFDANGAPDLAPACIPCPVGHACAPSSSNTTSAPSPPPPTPCPPGTYQDAYGATACNECGAGRHSTQTAAAEPCALCAANAYCPTPTQQIACPAGTESAAGAASLLQCTCVGGSNCVWVRQLLIRLTLQNTTRLDLWASPAHERFVHAMALSTGVPDANVNIEGIMMANAPPPAR